MMHQLLCFVLLIFSSIPTVSSLGSKSGGFTIELIHHDSPLSPFYNHSISSVDIYRNAARLSVSRLHHFHLSSTEENAIVVIPNGGGYLMNFSIGTPPVQVYAVADTGSDLIWIQCEPCQQCYPQDSPIFYPQKSSTYRALSCSSKTCEDVLYTGTCGSANECQYFYSYGDGSNTSGVLTTDTFVFDSINGQAVSFPTSVFGCGTKNVGEFSSRGAGLVGLGGGPLSLVSQLGAEIEYKFSYCLLPSSSNSPSKLRFGKEAVISGEGIVSTPLVSRILPTFYYLTLEGISIRNKTARANASEGNIIIDSGTTLTFLESSFYYELEAIVNESIGVESVQDTTGTFNLCYQAASGIAFPDMIFHFKGANLTLKPLNTFIRVDDRDCLAIVPSDSFFIFGNIAQVNFQVEYDLEQRQVSFAPADCTK